MTLIELARKLRPYIEKAAVSLSDEDALEAVQLYPAWQLHATYAVGDRVRYGDTLYRCLTAHTAQEGWTPDAAITLWEKINVSNAGTLTDPIPYGGNMVLTAGLYYTQDGVVYRCIRDTVNPVYHALSDLVGLYVEKV